MEADALQVDARLTDEFIPVPFPAQAPGAECGVVLEFRRLARGTVGDRPATLLRYEVFEKMADAQLREIASTLGRTHGATAVTLVHRHGLIPAGETVVYISVRAPHLKAATACLDDLVDVVQRDVPIWKIAVPPGAGGAAQP